MELSLQLSNCISSITTDALLIYIFCTSCEPENVLTVQEIKIKTILNLQHLQIHVNR